jgi:predicted transcriptional regulator
MLLTQIRDLLRDKGEASLETIAYALKSDEGLVEQVLEEWVRKGRVVKVTRDNPCDKSGIMGCSCSNLEQGIPIYQWKG